jgi:aspartyl-tRNA(Asn)/glutamyl-tRNA(Gln) amidotransferase subunit B
MEYKPTIGLEVHAELKTKTKMFCDCPNNPEAEQPNSNVCPICLGHPGTLPVINKRAIEAIIKIGLAIDGGVNEIFKFDRKNYFYPDLPKAYQISQFDMPIIKGGSLDISSRLGSKKIVKINRVHLEEDAAKLMHATDNKKEISLVDFNRGGVPLMELVSEPDIHSAEEATAYAKELQLILRYLGISDADLEKGQMRADANISISKDKKLGAKVEIKNLNSFRAIEQAINYEIKRQKEVLTGGDKIKQETRGWNDAKQITESQRSKEESHDYRYFPEPDLPSLTKDGFDVEKLKLEIPELPNDKRKRFSDQYKLSAEQMNVLIEDKEMSDYFEQSVSELESDDKENINQDKVKLLLNYLTSDLRGLLISQKKNFEQSKITSENFADLIDMIFKKEITSRVAKDLLVKMMDSGLDPRALVEQEGLGQVSDELELVLIVKKIIDENPTAVADYKKGKTNALQFLVGKAMAILRGRGNPEVLRSLLEKKLK